MAFLENQNQFFSTGWGGGALRLGIGSEFSLWPFHVTKPVAIIIPVLLLPSENRRIRENISAAGSYAAEEKLSSLRIISAECDMGQINR